jgi:hypothetical protein
LIIVFVVVVVVVVVVSFILCPANLDEHVLGRVKSVIVVAIGGGTGVT